MRVLLLEPHDLLARALRRGLEEEGLSVTVAAGPAGGEAAALKGDYDLIILDPPRGARDYPALIQRWQGRGLRSPVLVLTPADRTPAPLPPAVGSLNKPFEWDALLARLRALARGPAAPVPVSPSPLQASPAL